MSIFKGSRYQTVKEFTPIINKKDNRVRQLLHNRRVFTRKDLGSNFTKHTVQTGQILDELAFIYYGDESLWWLIADINELEYVFDVYPGQVLIIPDREILEGIIS